MTKETYKRYLKTHHWQQLRQQALDRANGKCEMCGYIPWKKGVLQVHHKTYINVGNESLDDLIVVCARCHMELHNIQGKRRASNVRSGAD